MAEIAYGSILSSKPFRFLIGPQKCEYFVHASLAASKSPVLNTIVNGSMNEAASGCTVWDNVDEDTFVRFGQWVYTGDYKGSAPSEPAVAEESATHPRPTYVAGGTIEPANATKLEAVDEPATNKVHRATDDWGFSTQEARPAPDVWEPAASQQKYLEDSNFRSSTNKKKLKKKKLMRAFVDEEALVEEEAPVKEYPFEEEAPVKENPIEEEAPPKPVAKGVYAEVPPLTKTEAWGRFKNGLRFRGTRHQDGGTNGVPPVPGDANGSLEYKEAFLSHARVHMMADYYEIAPLAQLALDKLHEILCAFTLRPARVGDVVALLRYCYDEDERPRLRALVSAFAACHLKQLWANDEFRELFSTHGQLSVAIVGDIMDRLG
ncbi:hypothetical protein V2A60_006019 [Cordyceps javanica]|uniref:BTB domain-containing protein n=1 Tax=Cordyceps javanica TaxID=43265 RepID=A0A545VQ12_9HYPO|nr:hypothetical protein IF1G_09465 [Cordyceps javanica]TQW03828.1 hypothetical protein IF2G_08657 [Cordyceps javanica]